MLWRAVVAVFRSGLCVRLFRCVLGCGFGQSLRQSAIAKPAQCLRFMPSLAPVTSLRSSLRSRHSTQHHARHARLRPVAAFPTLHRPPSAHALPPLLSSSCERPNKRRSAHFSILGTPCTFRDPSSFDDAYMKQHFAALVSKERLLFPPRKQKHSLSVNGFRSVFHPSDRIGGWQSLLNPTTLLLQLKKSPELS